MGNGCSPASSSTLISSQDWKSAQTGQVVMLTEEERRTLIAEGYPIPNKFPLSKSEERSLKKIRRKIKNKISAQESRRKKKEYMEELEKRVQLMEMRIVELELENKRLSANSSTTRHQQASKQSSKLQTGNAAPIASSESLPLGQSSVLISEQTPIVYLANGVETDKAKENNGEHQETTTMSAAAAATGGSEIALAVAEPTRQKSLDLLRALANEHEAHIDNRARQELASTQITTSSTTSAAPAAIGLDLLDDPGSSRQSQRQQQFGQGKRKNSVQSNFSITSNDDEIIDDILMSQERQEAAVSQLTSGDDDLVGNLVGDVCDVDLQQVMAASASSSSNLDGSSPATSKDSVERHSAIDGGEPTTELVGIKEEPN